LNKALHCFLVGYNSAEPIKEKQDNLGKSFLVFLAFLNNLLAPSKLEGRKAFQTAFSTLFMKSETPVLSSI